MVSTLLIINTTLIKTRLLHYLEKPRQLQIQVLLPNYHNFECNVLQDSPRAGASIQPCIPTEAKRETEEILNAILPPKEWEEDGQIWTQKVNMCLVSYT